MNEETSNQDQPGEPVGAAAVEIPEPQPEHAEHAEHPHKEPIKIELEDLTEEGKKKIEENLKHPIEEIPVTLSGREPHPGSRLHLSFLVARGDYNAEQARLLRDLQKEAVLPGYRKGKVPVKLLQIRLGEDAVRDTLRAVATSALRQENLKNPIKLSIAPQVVDYSVPPDTTQPVSFEIEAEVDPTVEAREYKGLTVEIETRPIAEEAVAQRLERMRAENAVVETTPEGAEVAAGDVLIVDTMVIGVQGQKLDNLSRTGWEVHDFSTQLQAPLPERVLGKKVGESVEAQVENKTTNRRGEEVTHVDAWTVTIQEIKRQRLPVLDDEFAKDLGEHETLEALKAKIRNDLEQAEEERQRSVAVVAIYRKIIELNPFDAPRSLMSAQAYQLIRRDSEELARYGMRLEHVVHDVDQYLRDQQASADEMVKSTLLLADIAKKESLSATDEDVEAEIARIAERQGRKPLAVRARLEANRQLDQFREQVDRRKVDDFLLANNTVNKVEAKPPAPPAEAEAPAAEAGAPAAGEEPAGEAGGAPPEA